MNEEEIGCMIRGRLEEKWTMACDDWEKPLIDTRPPRGDDRTISYLTPEVFYASDAPKPIKDLFLKRQLFG
jgi:hypothetical protein